MLDKLSENILDYMAGHPDVEEMNPNAAICAIVKEIDSEPRLIRVAVRFLKDNGFIDYRNGARGDRTGFQLSHKGLHSREFANLEAKERWKEYINGIIAGVITTVVAEAIIVMAAYGLPFLLSALQALLAKASG